MGALNVRQAELVPEATGQRLLGGPAPDGWESDKYEGRPISSLHLSEHDSPGWPIRGFSPRGVLKEPRQCSIAFLEPC
jgi:hypothetical protein